MSFLAKAQQPDASGRIQHVTPESAGWRYVGFDAYLLKKGDRLRLSSG
ncbi:MAG TPA: 5-deoxy-glucuronate isomerase, partial [Pantoea sp.]|nr:5-deoxy-glucuronate isomerase [Pantoea sp.]